MLSSSVTALWLQIHAGVVHRVDWARRERVEFGTTLHNFVDYVQAARAYDDTLTQLVSQAFRDRAWG